MIPLAVTFSIAISFHLLNREIKSYCSVAAGGEWSGLLSKLSERQKCIRGRKQELPSSLTVAKREIVNTLIFFKVYLLWCLLYLEQFLWEPVLVINYTRHFKLILLHA